MTVHVWRRRSRRALLRSFLIGLTGVFVLVPTVAEASPPAVRKPPPALTAVWWQEIVGISGDALDRCDLGVRDVVFLAGTTGAPATRSCTVPAGTSLLVPLISAECSTAEGDGDTPAELRRCARGIADQFTDLSLTIDGRSVTDLRRLRVRSPVFCFTAVEDNVFDIPAGATRSVADGYWALIRPLSPGTHTVSFGGSYPPGDFSVSVVYTLTVTG